MGMREHLEQAGVARVAVGSGSPDHARAFVESFGFDGDMYLSRDLSAYRAFHLVRGVWRSIGPGSVYHGIKALKRGFRQGPTQGDPWQQGGVFLIGPGERVAFAHRDRFAGDHAEPESILSALGSGGAP